MDYNDERDKFYNRAGANGFHDDDDNSTEGILAKLMLITTEVAEAAEEVREVDPMAEPRDAVRFTHKKDHTKKVFVRNQLEVDLLIQDGYKPDGINVEIADIIIRCFDLAGQLGLDIDKAIKIKHYYNGTRSYKHGKRA